ncbi:MAG TPA: phosphoribosylformylglycinamidine cyclo-ligase [Candidatus Nanopelagicaceae bacterium]|nr:phosphoribosylformylglycinamidine cyclo-ligase [Candidatus Nanopelagicaceae bacterium]
MTNRISYTASGVDIEAGDRAVELMKASIRLAQRPEVVGGIGGFAGLFDASSLKNYRKPLLATSTDGVGTKVEIARQMSEFGTIGEDLVAMVVDDLVVCGAEPLFMTDYIAIGKVIPEKVAMIVAGIARGCALAGTALIGGETAEHPGLLEPDEFDLAGAATGVVEEDQLLGSQQVRAGDVVIAMTSSGVHANGFSLIRQVIKHAGWSLDDQLPELSGPLGAELLIPTRIYALDALALAKDSGAKVHAMAHITGGGLGANLARVIPSGLHAVIDRSSWELPAIFKLLAEAGKLAHDELERTLNVGVGMVALVDPAGADRALAVLAERGQRAFVAGEIGTLEGPGSAALVGGYRNQ